MNNENLLEQKATGSAGCFQRLVIRLVLWNVIIALFVAAALIFEAGEDQPAWRKMVAFGLLWIGADINTYRKRKPDNEKS
jgi:hypothetical protein